MSAVDMLGSNTSVLGPNGDAADAGPAPTRNASSATSPTAHSKARLVQRNIEPLPRVAAAAAVSLPAGRRPGKPGKLASALQRREVAERARGVDHVEQQPQAVGAHGG